MQQVHKLSAPHSTFVKRVLPFVTMAAVIAWTYQSGRDNPNTLLITAIVGVAGLFLMWWVLRRGFWLIADVVEDHGDRLIVTRWKTRIDVPIENVKEVVRVRALAGSTVTIVLKSPSALGPRITFLAPGRRSVRDIEEKLDSLAMRVASKR
jgi:hypothetical protein